MCFSGIIKLLDAMVCSILREPFTMFGKEISLPVKSWRKFSSQKSLLSNKNKGLSVKLPGWETIKRAQTSKIGNIDKIKSRWRWDITSYLNKKKNNSTKNLLLQTMFQSILCSSFKWNSPISSMTSGDTDTFGTGDLRKYLQILFDLQNH